MAAVQAPAVVPRLRPGPVPDGRPARIRQVAIRGLRLRVSVRGEGPPLLLISGLGTGLELWGGFEEQLPGRQTITFDAPGVGGSPVPALPLRMPQLAAVVEGLLDVLDLDTVDVLGVSFGGALAQELARRTPRVRRLVLAATTYGLGALPGLPPALAAIAVPRHLYPPTVRRMLAPGVYGGQARSDPDLPAQMGMPGRVQLRSLRGWWSQLYAMAGWTSLPWLRRLQQPTLVLAGDDDPLVPLANAFVMGSVIPHARVHVVKGGGHLFLLYRAQEVARVVSDFLAEE